MKLIKKIDWLIIGILSLGLIYRLVVTSGGNFLFHFDSARDMLQVRELVVLHHPPLIGQTTGINGLFTGPLWFYILAVPFVLSGGNPYANIILMNIFWIIGGYSLLFIMKKRSMSGFIISAALWICSNYLLLDSVYAFNPNPVTFLTPIYFYGLAKYIETGKIKFAIIVGIFSATFWSLEIALGLFAPFIILIGVALFRKWKLLKQKNFWLAIVLLDFLGIAPLILFELRHNFFMSRNVYQYFNEQKSLPATFNISDRLEKVWLTFQEGFKGTFLNQEILIYLAIFIFVLIFITQFKKIFKDYLFVISIIMLIIPFLGFLILPLAIQRWHVDASLVCLILLLGFSVSYMEKIKDNKIIKVFVGVISIVVIYFSIANLNIPQSLDQNRKIDDPSFFKNEIKAIDYAYQQAEGKNFKAYVYSPGILDLSYQYNFWWYGQNTKYGYLPKDYAYLPNQPEYVPQKAKYSNGKNPPDSNLIILIKEPGYPVREDLWKNSFTLTKLLKSEMVGPLRIEVREEQ